MPTTPVNDPTGSPTGPPVNQPTPADKPVEVFDRATQAEIDTQEKAFQRANPDVPVIDIGADDIPQEWK
jgi:hypothetical protein